MEPAGHNDDFVGSRYASTYHQVQIVLKGLIVGLCDYNLSFLLVEELLESQTLDGCRRIFDYLESRRETMIAVCEHST
jgi:THO complex subunit 1